MKYTSVMAAVLAGLCLVLTSCGKNKAGVLLYADETQLQSTEEADSTADEADVVGTGNSEEDTVTENGVMYIYICGEVNNPGVYELASGTRICDAVEAAGGMTETAAEDYWNLAQVLTDGQMIYVPTEEEARERILPEAAGTSGDSGRTGGTAGGTAEQADDGRININTAGKEQLMTLPGIGEAKAESILAYREEHGDFSSIEEIMNVPGIKEGLFRKVEEHIKIH